MSNITLEPPITQDRVDKAFGYLTSQLGRMGADAQKKVQAHLTATCGKVVLLASYHNSKDFTMEQKYALYREVFQALIEKNGPDWSRLKGSVGNGEKRLDPIEAAESKTPARPTTSEPASIMPPTNGDTLNQGSRSVKPVPFVMPDNADPLTRAILQAVSPYLPQGGGPADVNEEQVEAIADKSARSAVTEALLEFEKDGFKKQLEKHLGNGSFPKERITELFNELSANLVKRIEFVTSTGEVKTIEGLMHPQVTQLAAWLKAGVPVWAWSKAGSGKTESGRQIAVMLEVEPYIVSVDPTLTVSKLLGYRNVANGDYVEGYIYKAYKEGGLVVLDEIDTGDPGVIASINAMLSNKFYLFPNNETVARHPKFYCMAAANTKGTGAVAGYTARNRLDAATLDRFAIIEFKYDTGLETALSCGEGAPGEPWKCGQPASHATQKNFVEWVQKVRTNVGESVLVSPRASINGCKALRSGVPLNEVVDALVFKLVAEDTRKRITDTCGNPEAV